MDNDEELKTNIRSLPIKEKIKAVGLYHYLHQKKILDKNLEFEMKTLQRRYEREAAPLFVKSNEIIEGSRLPNEDELADLDVYLKEEELT